MADNLTIKDGALDTRILRATDTAGVHTPHHVIEFDGGAVTALNPLPVSMSSDIQIGAVEIKDATTDARAVVGASGLYVDVQALPALPAGANNIGDVDVLTLPALVAGSANIGNVGLPGAILELSASSAKTESASGTAVACGQYRRFAVLLDVTALATDAGDTLDVFIDFSPDGGTTYVNAAHFTQQIGTGSAAKLWAVIDSANPGTSVVDVTADAVAGAVRPALFGGHIRARWAIVDDSTDDASFTFAVTAYAQ